ncbi:hypothetical protein GCM10009624_17600 [Gordonia sinesedis]
MESALRPREIQSRIRAGASVAEVAAIAGVGVDKVERFAHPVLLERTRATELAAHAHPLRHDGPSVATLADAVAEGLTAYGQNPADAGWDAWKGDDGYWVVQVTWHVGHSDHAAHWRFHPGSHGGTADPLDDLADELTHPESIQPRRRLAPVSAPPIPAPTPTVEIADDGHEQVTVDANSLIGAQRTRRSPVAEPDVEPAASAPARFDEHGTYALEFEDEDERSGTAAAAETDARPTVVDARSTDPRARSTEPRAHSTNPGARSTESRAHSTDTGATEEHAVTTPEEQERSPRRRKNGKPPVPAWEDVLLGVRSNTEQSS